MSTPFLSAAISIPPTLTDESEMKIERGSKQARLTACMLRHQIATALLAQPSGDIRKLLGHAADMVERYDIKFKTAKSPGK